MRTGSRNGSTPAPSATIPARASDSRSTPPSVRSASSARGQGASAGVASSTCPPGSTVMRLPNGSDPPASTAAWISSGRRCRRGSSSE